MPTAGTTTVTTEVAIYDDSNGCTSFLVSATAASAVSADINIPGLHAAGEYFRLDAGDSQVFRLNNLGIKSVTAKGVSGTATLNYGVVAITDR